MLVSAKCTDDPASERQHRQGYSVEPCYGPLPVNRTEDAPQLIPDRSVGLKAQ